jgi:hypothetical protein
MNSDGEWKRVGDEGELRPGMLVRVSPVDSCKGTAVFILEALTKPSATVRTVAPCCDDMSPGTHRLKASLVISERRLYRLVLPPDADTTDTEAGVRVEVSVPAGEVRR